MDEKRPVTQIELLARAYARAASDKRHADARFVLDLIMQEAAGLWELHLTPIPSGAELVDRVVDVIERCHAPTQEQRVDEIEDMHRAAKGATT
jgi:hypothetical protein